MKWLGSSCGVKRLEATIKLEYEDERVAAAVANAVSPDNLKAPSGLFIKTTREGCCVVTVIKAEVKMLTFLSTIDDLLSSALTSEKILRVVAET